MTNSDMILGTYLIIVLTDICSVGEFGSSVEFLNVILGTNNKNVFNLD